MLFPSKERERSVKNEIVLHPPNSDARWGGGVNPLSLRKKLMMRTHFQTVADTSEGGDIQRLLLTWTLASI